MITLKPARGLLAAMAFLPAWTGCLGAAGPTLAGREVARMQEPPRKVVVATVCTWLGRKMDAAKRVAIFDKYLKEAAAEAARLYPGDGLDLFVLPEIALQRAGDGDIPLSDRAMRLRDKEVLQVAAMAAREKTWLVLPMYLAEDVDGRVVYSNAAVLFDRGGGVAGIYRKLYPVADGAGVFEKGVTPGRSAPVFETDFGRLGIQICWDMSYEDGWAALEEGGAELVALPSMSPQTIPPAWYARRHRYWVVSSNPRDNVTVFNPVGLVDAQATKPGVLVHRIDLATAVIHWNPEIDDGRLFQRKYGERVGFVWSTREDTGLFWSNDASMPIGAMVKELGQETMDAQVERIGRAVKQH